MKWNVAASLVVVAFTGGALYGGATLWPDATGFAPGDAWTTVATTLLAVALIAGRHALGRRFGQWSGS